MLRDPVWANTSLLTVNPAGAAMNSFEQATGYGSAAFRIVRTGDTDGDGKDEIVILKGDRYRIYTDPDVGSQATETTGSFYAPSSSTTGMSAICRTWRSPTWMPASSQVPLLGVTPASLSFSLDCGDVSPLKPLSITNAGTGSSFVWQAQAIEANGSDWLLLDGAQSAVQGTTPGTVNVSVKNVSQGQLHRQDSDHHHGPRRPEQDRGCPRLLCVDCVRDSWSARPHSISTCRGAAPGRSL